jgi:hypothetical protein
MDFNLGNDTILGLSLVAPKSPKGDFLHPDLSRPSLL